MFPPIGSVPRGSHRRARERLDLSLITATIPNNGLGCWQLLNVFPEVRKAFLALPRAGHVPTADGPVWFYPHLAEWIIRRFLNLDDANRRVREATPDPWVPFHDRFSINCICYDYRPGRKRRRARNDEVGWGQ